jgi:hypothetical protein
MKGGRQSVNKIAIKNRLGITSDTPDSYNPKQDNLRDYYEKLLNIYINVWKNLVTTDAKNQLAEEFSRGRFAVYMHPGRSLVYRELISDLRLLDDMAIMLRRDPDLYDFSGKIFRGRLYSCVNFGFMPLYSLADDLEEDTEEDGEELLKMIRSNQEWYKRRQMLYGLKDRYKYPQILNPLEPTEPTEPTSSDYKNNILARIKLLDKEITDIKADGKHPDHDRLEILEKVKKDLEEAIGKLILESEQGNDMEKPPPSDTEDTEGIEGIEGGTKSSRRCRRHSHRRGANKKSRKVHRVRKFRRRRNCRSDQ